MRKQNFILLSLLLLFLIFFISCGPDDEKGNSVTEKSQTEKESEDKDKNEIFFRCEVKMSDERSDYDEMADEDWLIFKPEKEPIRGDLCFYTSGNDLSELKNKCEHAATLVNSFFQKEDPGFSYRAKGYAEVVKEGGFCDVENFTIDNDIATSSCDCSFYDEDKAYTSVVGNDDLCELVFSDC